MFKKLTLDNGLRIILAPQKESLATTILVLVEAGSEYETKDISGLSHFLEHMCFKGTKKRPDEFAIARELDSIGAAYNAFTGQEYTGYYAKAQIRHFEKILDVVSDLYLNPVFKKEHIEKERGVIIEEINMYEDMPNRRVQEIFTTLLYGDQPAGWDVAGRKEVVQKLTRDDFIKYRGQHYVASATVVVIAGNFNEKEIVSSLKGKFKNIAADKKAGKEKTTESQDKPAVSVTYKESDQTHLILGVRAFDTFDKRKYPLQILADILGGSMSSRLFQKVRGELGAAYYIKAGTDLFLDHGFLAVSAGANHQKMKEVVKAVLEEFQKSKKEKVNDEELQRAKDHLIGGLILSLETSDELASFYGGQEILEKSILEPEELIKKIQKVTADEIISVADCIFKKEKLNLALIGPLGKKGETEKQKGELEKILNL